MGKRSTAPRRVLRRGLETCLGNSGSTSCGRKGALWGCTLYIKEIVKSARRERRRVDDGGRMVVVEANKRDF